MFVYTMPWRLYIVVIDYNLLLLLLLVVVVVVVASCRLRFSIDLF